MLSSVSFISRFLFRRRNIACLYTANKSSLYSWVFRIWVISIFVCFYFYNLFTVIIAHSSSRANAWFWEYETLTLSLCCIVLYFKLLLCVLFRNYSHCLYGHFKITHFILLNEQNFLFQMRNERLFGSHQVVPSTMENHFDCRNEHNRLIWTIVSGRVSKVILNSVICTFSIDIWYQFCVYKHNFWWSQFPQYL